MKVGYIVIDQMLTMKDFLSDLQVFTNKDDAIAQEKLLIKQSECLDDYCEGDIYIQEVPVN
jgi:hypothetical protein